MPPSRAPSARVATYNLLHGMHLRTGRAEPAALAEAARATGADLIGVQEVDRHQERSGSVDQVEVVAEALGLEHWRFVPAVHGTPGVDTAWTPATADDGSQTTGPTYGIGLASRWPVRHWWVRRFDPAPWSIPLLVPDQPRPRLLRVPDEPRLALAALVDGPAGPFTVATCHLSFVPGYNWRQLRAVTHWVARMPPPVFVLGDFNLPGRLPAWATGWQSLTSAATYPSYRPRIRLDHVLSRGLGPDAAEGETALALEVSDHCALTVDVDLTNVTR